MSGYRTSDLRDWRCHGIVSQEGHDGSGGELHLVDVGSRGGVERC